MDLGRENKMEQPAVASPAQGEGPKMTYPSFSINDDQVDEFFEQCKLGINEEATATVRLRLADASDGQYGKRLGFDVLSMNGIKKTEGGSEDEGGESETEEGGESDYPNPAVAKMMRGPKR